MRRVTSAACILALLSGPALLVGAHGTSSLPGPGSIDISTFWVPSGGTLVDVWWVEDDHQAITRFGFHAVTSRFNVGGAGLNSMVEVGLVPGLAAGVELNFPDIVVAGLQGGGYRLDLGLSLSVLIATWHRFGLQSRLEVEAEPLIGTAVGLDDGYFNVFLALGASYLVHEDSRRSFWVYLDAKALTSLENPAYRTPVGTFEHLMGLPTGSTQGLPAQTGPIVRIALAPGLEARFGRFFFHVGFNLPIISFHSYYVTGVFFSGFGLGIESLEFSWRCRL